MNDLVDISVSKRLAAGSLSPEEALQHAMGLAQTLRRMHQQGTICTSLDPAHVMLGEHEIRIVQNSAGGLTPYAPPERLRGETLDARSDVFGFGAIAYELLSGRKAFPAEDPEELKTEILESDPQPLTEVPRGVASILSRCLAKRPEDRWQRMSSVLIELKHSQASSASVYYAPLQLLQYVHEWSAALPALLADLLARIELVLRGYRFSEGEIIARLIDAVFEGIAIDVAQLVQLLGDMELYLGALGMRDDALRAGLEVCLPEFVQQGERRTLTRLYNPLLLAHGTAPVPCDIDLDASDATVSRRHCDRDAVLRPRP